MVGVQLIAFAHQSIKWITLVGGLAGIICVNLIAKEKSAIHFWVNQCGDYWLFWVSDTGICEVLLQSFYIIMDITGLYAWLQVAKMARNESNRSKKVLKGIQWLYAFSRGCSLA